MMAGTICWESWVNVGTMLVYDWPLMVYPPSKLMLAQPDINVVTLGFGWRTVIVVSSAYRTHKVNILQTLLL